MTSSKGLSKLSERRSELLSGIGTPGQGEFKPDKFQIDAIEYLEKGWDTLVIAPTGSGKTYIAIEAIRTIASRGGRCIYTAPLKALSNAKYADFKKRFEPEFSVGLLTGDRKIETDATIVVATTEIYRNHLFDSESNFSLVVLDEFHYLADYQRGPVWEESIILSSRESTMLMLSASVSNVDEIVGWIKDTREKDVVAVGVEKRPVELRLAFMHPRFGVVPLCNDEMHLDPAVQEYYSGGGRSGRPGKLGIKDKSSGPRRRKHRKN